MSNKSSAGSETKNFLSVVFMALAGLFILAGVALLLYAVWGLISGQGWQQFKITDFAMMDGLRGSGYGYLVYTILAAIPLDIALIVFGWIFSKISDRFENAS